PPRTPPPAAEPPGGRPAPVPRPRPRAPPTAASASRPRARTPAGAGRGGATYPRLGTARPAPRAPATSRAASPGCACHDRELDERRGGPPVPAGARLHDPRVRAAGNEDDRIGERGHRIG